MTVLLIATIVQRITMIVHALTAVVSVIVLQHLVVMAQRVMPSQSATAPVLPRTNAQHSIAKHFAMTVQRLAAVVSVVQPVAISAPARLQMHHAAATTTAQPTALTQAARNLKFA